MKALLCALLMILPALCLANDPPPGMWALLFFVLLTSLVFAETLIVVVEAVVYRIALRVRFRTAIGMSFVANVASVLAGWILYEMRLPFLIDPVWYEARALGAAVAVLVTVGVETPIVWAWIRKLREKQALPVRLSDKRVLWTAIVTNVITNGTFQILFYHPWAA